MATTTINPSDQTIAQYNVQTGGASNLLNNVAPSATSGVPFISQGASAQPIYGIAVVAGGGTGLATLTAHALQVGNGTGTVTQLGVGATGTILKGVTGADPSFTAYPQVSGLGLGASPGSTAGLTFDGINFMNNYVGFTAFTPTLFGNSTAGSTTYSVQLGYYMRVGSLVYVAITITISGATGTGNALIGNLPLTSNSNISQIGSVSLTNWTWPASTTMLVARIAPSETQIRLESCGSGVGLGTVQMANAATTIRVFIVYSV